MILKYFSRLSSYFIAFFLPFLLLGGVLIVWRVYPFGPRSILMADEYTQYVQFYNHFYDVFRGGHGSLFYTWEEGMGLNFWATFAYYLSSPISFVVLLFKRGNLPEAIILLVLIKIGLSGLMMNIYFSKLFRLNKLTNLMFSTMYALISFSIGYFFNIMWLDSVYMLPLVLLGVEYLFNKKPILLAVSLILLFISNFYMAYIVGLFTFLYFIFRVIAIPNMSLKMIFTRFCLFIGCALIAGGISAFITLPTYLLLKSNGSPPIQWGDMLTSPFGFFDLLPKFYNSSIRYFDLPNVYSGLLVMLLFPMFFMNSKIAYREKIAYFGFLLILILSLQINGINLVWHAFSVPTGYYERFAFVVSFFIIFLAFKSFMSFEIGQVSSLFKVYLANVFILVLLTKLTPDFMSINKAWLNILLLTVFCFLLYGKVAFERYGRLIPLLLLIFVCMDMGLNAYQQIKTLNTLPGYSITRDQYNVANPGFERVVNKLNQEDHGLYRTNSIVRLTPNDSIRYGYKGMTNFNTLSNGTLHAFMQSIGYSSTLGPRSLAQNQGILTSDALFGFKYEVSDQPVNKFGYEKVSCDQGICLYKNNFSMPIGFMADQQQFTYIQKEDNPFVKQNQLMGPGDKDYFSPLTANTIIYHNLTVNNEGGVQYIKKIDANQEGSIEMVFTVKGEKQLYTQLSAGKGFAGFNETTIFVNGKSLGVYPTYHNERVLDLGAFTNQKVTVKIVFSVADTQLAQQLFYQLDVPSFEDRITELKKHDLKVTDWKETSVSGKVDAATAGPLFLSIPYDKGWTAKVDGKPMPIEKLGGFIGVQLDKGEHTITLSYLPDGFKTGSLISIGTFLLLLVIYLAVILKTRRSLK